MCRKFPQVTCYLFLSRQDLEKHIQDVHTEIFKCEYCDFVGKTEGGLKTHTRFKHTKYTYNSKNCTFCNFYSKTEAELEKHIETFRNTHSNLNYNTHRQKVDAEISEMTNRGYVLTTFQNMKMQMDYLQKNDSNYFSGKGPR